MIGLEPCVRLLGPPSENTVISSQFLAHVGRVMPECTGEGQICQDAQLGCQGKVEMSPRWQYRNVPFSLSR
jgi:hypothetical protein